MDLAIRGTGVIHNEIQESVVKDIFLNEWKNIADDQDFLDYINSKQPEPFTDYLTYTRNASYFTDNIPTRYAAFAYDAVVAFGLSACNSIDTNIIKGKKNPYFFSGEQQKKEFMNLEFVGASDEILFDQSGETNSRIPRNFHFEISNILGHTRADSMVEFDAEPVYDFDPKTQVWTKQDGKNFIFHDGTTGKSILFIYSFKRSYVYFIFHII